MLRITFLLVTAIAGISCERGSGTRTVPLTSDAVEQSDGAESRLHHPADHPLREVPILIGLPSKEMQEEVRKGEALLGGCVGTPGAIQAKVCERCRWWKTDEMKYWQPLPKEFGELAAKDGG